MSFSAAVKVLVSWYGRVGGGRGAVTVLGPKTAKQSRFSGSNPFQWPTSYLPPPPPAVQSDKMK